MAVVFPLTKLFDDVTAIFAADAAAVGHDEKPVPNLFGWRSPAQHGPQGPRINWVPGGPNGALGTLAAARPTRAAGARSLGTLVELFYVEIKSNDGTDPENERKQYQAVRELHDAWWRAAYLSAGARLQVVSSEWLTEKLERRFGAALRVVCTVEAMIPDEPYTPVPTDPSTGDVVSALIDVTELDHTETVRFTPPSA